MKKQYNFLLLCIFSTVLLSAQKKHDRFKFLGDAYNKINDTLYAASFEVTNADYREFLKTLTCNEYELCKVDSSRWVKTFRENYNEPMWRHYHTHPAFDQYPVLCVPHYGAEEYCKWLSYRHYVVSSKKITFRLPSEEEWVLLSNYNPATKLPYNLLDGGRNEKGKYLENIGKRDSTNSYQADSGFYTLPVNAYYADEHGLYNVIGNAAEMTNQDRVHKGGSWENFLSDCKVDQTQSYPTPDVRVGFRVIAIVYRRK